MAFFTHILHKYKLFFFIFNNIVEIRLYLKFGINIWIDLWLKQKSLLFMSFYYYFIF